MHLINKEKNPLWKLSSISSLCQMLNVKKGHLLFICYQRSDASKYKSFEIHKKRGGVRKIDSPQAGLKLIQERLALLLSSNIAFKECVHGFTTGKSICSNAVVHKKHKWVLNLDIKNFFESINFGRIRGALIAEPFEMEPKVATVIAQICTYQNCLPQGAPTSPILSNIIGSMLDNKILRHLKKDHLIYSRYVDDITISSNNRFFPENIAYIKEGETIVSEKLISIFERSNFEINQKKTRLQMRNSRQEVTGLVVNQKLNIPYEYKNKLRAAIKQWCHSPEVAEHNFYTNVLHDKSYQPTKNGQRLRDNIYGRLSFMSMVKGADDPTYIKLMMKMLEKDIDPPKPALKIKDRYQMYDVFLCHASEDKDHIATPIFNALKNKGLNAFLDSKEITWGDSLTDKIGKALVQSKFVIAILTANSVEKSWPRKEINAVLNDEINNGKKRLLPLVFGDTKTILNSHYLMSDKLYLEWDDNPDAIADKVLELIKTVD